MGDYRIVWIPIAMREMAKEIEGKEILITLEEL